MHYKAGKYSRKALLFVAVYSRHTRWVRFPTYPCSLTYYEFCKTGVPPQLHKSKTVYVVDGVASRYTNSRTYGVAWFWLQYTSFTENSPNYNSKSYTTFSAADLELAA
jgi:hypothetical protein